MKKCLNCIRADLEQVFNLAIAVSSAELLAFLCILDNSRSSAQEFRGHKIM